VEILLSKKSSVLYFFYFSNGGDQIGVVSGPTPVGPWKDPLGKPLIPKTIDYFIAELE
jgi:hypothetical protein